MGANVSKTTTEIVNETITDQSSQIMNSTEMSTRSTLDANQKMDVDFRVGGSIKNCDLNFIQELTIVNKVYSKIDAEAQQMMIKEIEQKLKNEATDKIEQEIKNLPIGVVNKSEANKFVRNYDFHDLSTLVVNTLKNNVNNAIDANQDQQIRVNIAGDFDCSSGDAKGLIVSQNIDMENIIENTLKDKKITETVNDFSKEVENVAKTEVSQKIAGLDPFAFIGMIFGILIVIGAIVLGVIFLPRIMKSSSKFGRRRRR